MAHIDEIKEPWVIIKSNYNIDISGPQLEAYEGTFGAVDNGFLRILDHTGSTYARINMQYVISYRQTDLEEVTKRTAIRHTYRATHL